MKALIALLTAATGILHLLVGFDVMGGFNLINWILVLNGVGYLVLLWLFWTSSGSRRGTIRWILLAYTLITLVGYFVINGSAGLPERDGLDHQRDRTAADHPVVPGSWQRPRCCYRPRAHGHAHRCGGQQRGVSGRFGHRRGQQRSGHRRGGGTRPDRGRSRRIRPERDCRHVGLGRGHGGRGRRHNGLAPRPMCRFWRNWRPTWA